MSAVEVGYCLLKKFQTYLALQEKYNPASPDLNKIEFYQKICIFHP
jgi:hypothetical protein